MKKVNKIQNSMFVDADVSKALKEIKTGEEAISFFAKVTLTFLILIFFIS